METEAADGCPASKLKFNHFILALLAGTETETQLDSRLF